MQEARIESDGVAFGNKGGNGSSKRQGSTLNHGWKRLKRGKEQGKDVASPLCLECAHMEGSQSTSTVCVVVGWKKPYLSRKLLVFHL